MKGRDKRRRETRRTEREREERKEGRSKEGRVTGSEGGREGERIYQTFLSPSLTILPIRKS